MSHPLSCCRVVIDRLKCPAEVLCLQSADSAVSNNTNSLSSEKSEEQNLFELDEEGNQIPVIQVPLSDLISDTGLIRTIHSSHLSPDCRRPDMRKAHLSEPHSCSSAAPSAASTPDSKQAKNAPLDAARAQLAVSAVYHNLLPDGSLITGKGCMDLGDPVLRNGPDRLNAMLRTTK